MVRYINCVRRAEGVTPSEFASFWQNKHFTELVEKTAELYKAERWSKSLVLMVEANISILQLSDSSPPYDGIIEYFWNSGSDLMNIYESREGAELYREMVDYQSQFVDFDSSPQFFTEA